MKNEPFLKFLLLVSLAVFNLNLVYALGEDSTAPRKPSTMNDTWFNNAEPEQHFVIDSTIFHLEEYNVIQRDGREYTNMGNTGTAAYPLIFDMNRSTGFNTGFNQFDLYRYQKDSIRYYQVIRPYAELSMVIGLKKEQMYIGRFANQHKGMIYYGVDFTRISSPGAYVNQKTNNNSFYLYAIFNSKNKHWNLQADLIFNSFKVQENGGTQQNVFDSSYFDKNLAPVASTSAENDYQEINFYFKTSYNAGKNYFERKNDTLRTRTLMPLFRISHQFNVEKNTFKYMDMTPQGDSAYYGNFYRPDSVVNKLSYLKIGNSIILEYHPRKLTSDSTYSEKDFIAYAEAGFDYYMLTQNKKGDNFTNGYVSGTFRNNYASKPKVIYRASVKYYLFGFNQNDFIADALAGYNFGVAGIFIGNFSYQLKAAPYIYQHFYYDSLISWNYNLPKTKVFDVGGKYQNIKYGLIADLNYYVADHLPVYPGLSSPYVTTGVENVIVAHVGNRNGIKGFHIDNDIWFSEIANTGYIRQTYPVLYTKHSIYYERRVFKNFLWLDIGFDLRIRFQNNSPYYDPLLGAFYPSNTALRTYPVLDFFANFKIKTVRIFFKVPNISSAIGGKGYYSAYNYPAADVSFKAGIKWRFFE